MTQDVYVGEGKYILGKKLGGGSFGDIYLGINKHTREFVAIKLVFLTFSQERLSKLMSLNRSHERRASICS